MTDLPTVHHVPVQPGARYVVTHAQCLPRPALYAITEKVAQGLGVPEDHVTILDGGLELSVLSPLDARRVPDLLEANNRLHHRNVNLSCAVMKARGVFIEYAQLHEAKGTEDGAAKARTNRQHAAYLDDFATAFGADPVTALWRRLAQVHQLAANFSSMLAAHEHNTGEALGTEDAALVDDWTRQLDQIGQAALDEAPEGALTIALRADPEDTPPVVDVKEAGPVIAGGSALVAAFCHKEGLDKGLDDQVDVPALLVAFVAFAADQMKARMARPAGGTLPRGRDYVVGERGGEVVDLTHMARPHRERVVVNLSGAVLPTDPLPFTGGLDEARARYEARTPTKPGKA